MIAGLWAWLSRFVQPSAACPSPSSSEPSPSSSEPSPSSSAADDDAPITPLPATVPSPRPVAYESDNRYPAKHHGGTRPTTRVVVVHSTEGGSAAGAASWFASGKVKASAHVCVDDGAIFRCVPDELQAWAAHPFNNDGGLHIEIAGYAKWTRGEWLQHDERLRKSARVIAAWCAKYAIPATWLGAEDVRSNAKSCRGLVTHADCVKGSGVGTHWDPGPGFPVDVLLHYVREELAKGGADVA